MLGRDRATGTVHFIRPTWGFAAIGGGQPRAGAPYRARTKGTTEAGVKYVKRNALAGRCFASFRALEQHLAAWMGEADRRIHETTHDGAARSVRPRRARGLAPRICAAPAAESGGD